MALEPGEILGERWELTARAPAPDAVRRWRARAVDTGEEVELVSPAGGPAERRTAFERQARGLSGVADPALAPVSAVLVLDGTPWLVRPPLDDRTLAEVRGPLPPEIAAWIGASLAPALLAAGGRAGAFVAETDLALDRAGRPVLAPLGRPPGRVELGTGRGVAPEVFHGGQPDGRSALYGLGAVLFRLVTGTPIPSAGSGRPPLRASALRPDVPPALDEAIAALLSADPDHRPAGAAALGSLAGPPVDLRTWAAPVPTATAELRLPTTPARPPRHPVHLVAPLDPGRPDRWTALADRAGLPATAIAELAEAGLPVVLGSFPDRRSARRAARAGDRVVARGSAVSIVATVALVLVGLLAIVPALALGIPALALVAVPLLLVAAGLEIARVAAAGAFARADRAASVLAAGRPIATGPIGRAWDRLRRARTQLEALALPASAAADLRSALREAERRLEGLAEVVAATESATRDVDPARLRARAGTGDPTRIDRALADLDALSRTRADALREVDDVHDALDALVVTAGRLATAEPEESGDDEAELRRKARALGRQSQ